VIAGWRSAMNPDLEVMEVVQSLSGDGNFLAWATVLSGFWCTGLVVIFSSMRQGVPITQYLNLNPVRAGICVRWLGAVVAFLWICEQLYLWLDLPGSDFLVEAYSNTQNVALLWFAIVIVAPLFEEFFFRGFLFDGLRDSKAGSVGAVLITSLLWAAIHQQYGLVELTMIGVLGLFLGIARIQTGSLYVPIVLHCFWNLAAMGQVALLLSNQSLV